MRSCSCPEEGKIVSNSVLTMCHVPATALSNSVLCFVVGMQLPYAAYPCRPISYAPPRQFIVDILLYSCPCPCRTLSHPRPPNRVPFWYTPLLIRLGNALWCRFSTLLNRLRNVVPSSLKLPYCHCPHVPSVREYCLIAD